MPASFCGIHIYESSSRENIENTPSGDISIQNGGLLNSTNHVARSNGNIYMDTPRRNKPERIESLKMKTFSAEVEVNGNSKDSINIDTVTS